MLSPNFNNAAFLWHPGSCASAGAELSYKLNESRIREGLSRSAGQQDLSPDELCTAPQVNVQGTVFDCGRVEKGGRCSPILQLPQLMRTSVLFGYSMPSTSRQLNVASFIPILQSFPSFDERDTIYCFDDLCRIYSVSMYLLERYMHNYLRIVFFDRESSSCG